jgi:hypothetical protein
MEENNENWKTVTLIVGAVVGLVCGIVAAYILIQRAQEHSSKPRLTAGEGVKVGLGVLGVLRLISDLGTKR